MCEYKNRWLEVERLKKCIVYKIPPKINNRLLWHWKTLETIDFVDSAEFSFEKGEHVGTWYKKWLHSLSTNKKVKEKNILLGSGDLTMGIDIEKLIKHFILNEFIELKCIFSLFVPGSLISILYHQENTISWCFEKGKMEEKISLCDVNSSFFF